MSEISETRVLLFSNIYVFSNIYFFIFLHAYNRILLSYHSWTLRIASDTLLVWYCEPYCVKISRTRIDFTSSLSFILVPFIYLPSLIFFFAILRFFFFLCDTACVRVVLRTHKWVHFVHHVCTCVHMKFGSREDLHFVLFSERKKVLSFFDGTRRSQETL